MKMWWTLRAESQQCGCDTDENNRWRYNNNYNVEAAVFVVEEDECDTGYLVFLGW
jgi:hypothetical protein